MCAKDFWHWDDAWKLLLLNCHYILMQSCTSPIDITNAKDFDLNCFQIQESDDSTLRKSGNRDSADDFTRFALNWSKDQTMSMLITFSSQRHRGSIGVEANRRSFQRHLINRRNDDWQRNLCIAHWSFGQVPGIFHHLEISFWLNLHTSDVSGLAPWQCLW